MFEYAHEALLAVEFEAETAVVVAEDEGVCRFDVHLRGFLALALQAAAEFVAEAVFGGHEGFAVVVSSLLQAALQGLCSMVFVEVFGLLVDDVGAVVEMWVGQGCPGEGCEGRVDRMEVLHTALLQELYGTAPQVVEGEGGDEVVSLGSVDDFEGGEGGVAEFGQLAYDEFVGAGGVLCCFVARGLKDGGNDAVFIFDFEREAFWCCAEEQLHVYLAFGGAALQLFLEGLVVVAPHVGADGDVGHGVGGECAPVGFVDVEALEVAVSIEEAEAVASGEGFVAAEGERMTTDGGDFADVLADGFLGVERSHGLAVLQEVVGVAPVEGALGVGGEEEGAAARGGGFVAVHQAVEQLTVVGGDVLHVAEVLETAFDLERRDACIYHGTKLLGCVEVAEREEVFLFDEQAAVAVQEVVGAAAGLRAATAVAAAAGKILAHIALAAVAHAEGAVDEGFEVDEGGLADGFHLVERGLAGEDDAFETHLFHELYALGGVVVALCAGVQLDGR